MSGWGATGKGTKDSTFFPGLSRSGSFERNVCRLPTPFRHFGLRKKKTELSQRMALKRMPGKGKKLTNPVIWTFSAGNNEDLASCPRNGNGAAHNPWC